MLRNYLKTSFRFLLKNKTFSLINIIGLAAGTLCCIYIILYVQQQYSYDKNFKDVKDIYRITTTLGLTGDQQRMATASPPIAPAMKNDFPEVKQFTRVVNSIGAKQYLLKFKDKSFYESGVLLVDSTFFDIFNFHFTNGKSANTLNEPYTVVLLKPVANKLFGNQDPIGKTIEIQNKQGKNDYKVTGVVDESLGKSHIHGNLFISMNSGGLGEFVRSNQSWAGNNFTNSYIKVQPHTNVAALEAKLPAFLLSHGEQQFKTLGIEKQLHLQPVTSIHTTKGYEAEMSTTVSPGFLFALMLIAVLIQIIACINFMNLSTARATGRALEVGVRKVIGAGRKDLIKQFITESFLVTLVGVLIAIPLLLLVLPYLNGITGADLRFSSIINYKIGLLLFSVIFGTGLLAGSYPAFYLSSFEAIKVIKGNFTNRVSAAGIRRALVVFQFVLSIILIAGIIVIYRQLNYIDNKDLGFDKNQRLIFNFYTDDAIHRMDDFAKDLRGTAGVSAVSESNNYLSQFVFNDYGVYLSGGNMANSVDVPNMTTDDNFVKANGIKLIAGRDFRLNDSGKVLVNESLIKRLNLTRDKAIGTRLYTQNEPDPPTYVEIAGVMKDFNFRSLRDDIGPFMLVYSGDKNNFSHLVVAVESKNYPQLLQNIKTLWQKDLHSVPFEYSFLDEDVQKQYEAEITLSRIINSFTIMAIIISCLGLFGLSAFRAEQRKKEIGVRKVLGASLINITSLLSADFLKLVVVSMGIATPFAWWAMHQWLQAFAYRVNIGWWIFVMAGATAFVIALITVSFQAIKAAIANPVESLRTE